MRRRLVGCGLLFVLLACSGCASHGPRFTARAQLRSFDMLWAVLRDYYAYPLPRNEWEQVRERYRPDAKGARSPDEFLAALSGMIAELNDPHIRIKNLEEWRQQYVAARTIIHSGNERYELTSLLAVPPVRLHRFDGRSWVEFLVPPEWHSTAPEPQSLYECLTINGLPAVPATAEALVRPWSRVAVRVRTVGGVEHEAHVRAGQPMSDTQAEALVNTARQILARAPATAPPPAAPPRPLVFPSPDPPPPLHWERILPDNIGYINLTSVDGAETTRQFDVALDALMDTAALVLDLRENPGGIIDGVRGVLGRFVDHPQPFAMFHFESGMPRVLSFLVRDRSRLLVRVSPRPPAYSRPVVVLIGDNTGSGGEVLAFALRDVRRSVLVGRRTAGACAGLDSVDLPVGLTVEYSRFPMYRLDGRTYQCIGIEPDEMVALDLRRLAREGHAYLVEAEFAVLDRGIRLARELALSN